MKLKILIFSFFLLTCVTNAQTIYLKIGPTFSKLTWNNSMVSNANESFNKGIVGVNAIIGVNYLNIKHFCLSSNLGFIQKGGSQNVEIVNKWGDIVGSTNDILRLNYLTINTTFNLKTSIVKILEPYIFAGPRLDYLISYKEKYYFLKQFDNADKLNNICYGLIFGGGINCSITKFRVGIAFDYYYNINKQVDFVSNSGVTNTLFDKTYTINALIGYKF